PLRRGRRACRRDRRRRGHGAHRVALRAGAVRGNQVVAALPDRSGAPSIHVMDPVSDVLRAVRLTGAYFYLVEAGPPWSVFTAPARELVPRILPQAEHLISYHILVSGSCWG